MLLQAFQLILLVLMCNVDFKKTANKMKYYFNAFRYTEVGHCD